MGKKRNGSTTHKPDKTTGRKETKWQIIVGANSWLGKPIGPAIKLFSLAGKLLSQNLFMRKIMNISSEVIEEISGGLISGESVFEDIKKLHNFMQRNRQDIARASLTWNRPEGEGANDQNASVFADGNPVALGLGRIESTIIKMVLYKHGFRMKEALIGVLWTSIISRVGILFRDFLYKGLLFEEASTAEKLYPPENSLRSVLDAAVREKFSGNKDMRFLLNHLDKSPFNLGCVVSDALKPHLRKAIRAAKLNLEDGANTVFNQMMEIFFCVRGEFSKKKHLEGTKSYLPDLPDGHPQKKKLMDETTGEFQGPAADTVAADASEFFPSSRADVPPAGEMTLDEIHTEFAEIVGAEPTGEIVPGDHLQISEPDYAGGDIGEKQPISPQDLMLESV